MNLENILDFDFRKRIRVLYGLASESYGLIFSSALDLPTQNERISIIQSRIRSLAWVLAIGFPLWSILDAIVFPYEVWQSLLIARLLAGAAFASFLLIGGSYLKSHTNNLWIIYLELAIIFLIPSLFYILCNNPPDYRNGTYVFSAAIAQSYSLVPLVSMACLGFFPLTLVEALGVAMPLLTIFYRANTTVEIYALPYDISMDWLMVVMAMITVIISTSQLRMLRLLVNYSSYDKLTDCLGRRSGEEITRMMWNYSVRKKSKLTIAFIDLDNFKLVNDCFGHQIGDEVLAGTATRIKSSLRKSDFVVRWGGEEFLVIMPDADIEDATKALTRMAANGFGTRPDGTPQTVSMGIAERIDDKADDEGLLIQMADERLYLAKIEGRCRAVSTKTILLK